VYRSPPQSFGKFADLKDLRGTSYIIIGVNSVTTTTNWSCTPIYLWTQKKIIYNCNNLMSKHFEVPASSQPDYWSRFIDIFTCSHMFVSSLLLVVAIEVRKTRDFDEIISSVFNGYIDFYIYYVRRCRQTCYNYYKISTSLYLNKLLIANLSVPPLIAIGIIIYIMYTVIDTIVYKYNIIWVARMTYS